jgi:hypothetical protein
MQFAHEIASPVDPEPNVFARFAAEAERDVSAASAIRVTVHSCHSLKLSSHDPASQVYVQYEFPGYLAAVDTALKPGTKAEFNESRTFEFAPNPQSSPSFCEALQKSVLTFAVFDASAVGDASQVGVCRIPLQCAPHPCIRLRTEACALCDFVMTVPVEQVASADCRAPLCLLTQLYITFVPGKSFN